MKDINKNNLDAAITLGEAVCNELGICCDARGRVIYQLYRKLEELESKDKSINEPEKTEVPVEESDITEVLS